MHRKVNLKLNGNNCLYIHDLYIVLTFLRFFICVSVSVVYGSLGVRGLFVIISIPRSVAAMLHHNKKEITFIIF